MKSLVHPQLLFASMPSFVKLVLQVLVLSALGYGASGHAAHEPPANHIIEQAIFRDTSGKMPLSEVVDAPFSEFKGIFAGGYTSDTLWVRLKVRPAANHQELVLHIQPTYLGKVTLYSPTASSPISWSEQTTGSSVPWLDRPLSSINLGFTIHPTEPTAYYLRIRTTSNALLNILAMPSTQVAHLELTNILWQCLYMALMLWIVLWALHDYWLNRDQVILIFAITYLAYLVYVMAILGYLAPMFPNTDQLPKITFWIVTLAVMASLHFHRLLLSLFDVSAWARWTLHSLFASSVFALGLLLMDQTQSALKLNSLLAIAASPLLFLTSLSARKDTKPGRRRLRLLYGILSLFIFSYTAPLLGWSEASNWTLYGALVQGLVSSILFGNLLHIRSRQLVDHKAQSTLALQLSAHELDIHKTQLADQGRFTAMLTHELKNPLAIIRLNVDTLSHSQNGSDDKKRHRIALALRDIDTLIERCVQSDRMEQGRHPLLLAPVNLPQLVIEWRIQNDPEHRICVETDPAVQPIHSDHQQLTVIVSNVLENAIKYSPPRSPIEVRFQPEMDASGHQGLRMDVANMPGMAGWPNREQAFVKYHRGSATTRHNGTGLGLYLVKGTIEKLGGQVQWRPHPHHIVLSLWFPLAMH